MTESVYIRVNGCGNAWPVFLGEDHPFYNRFNGDDLGSASYSLIGCNTKRFSIKSVEWEIVIDAGHNTVPFLLRNENRIPEAVFLTHGHLDHILGTDWIAQSLNFKNTGSKKLPVYATYLCHQQLLQTIPHIQGAVNLCELKPGIKSAVNEIKNLHVTAFPVYHGDSARGAVMLLFEYKNGKNTAHALFTGDMVFPFLRNEDYTEISKAKVLYIDCTNRYCYPASNHTGFTGRPDTKPAIPDYTDEWRKNNPIEQIVKKQIIHTNDPSYTDYFRSFLQQNKDYNNIPFTITAFLNKTGISNANLVHYSGYHDKKYYGEKVMNRHQLNKWAKSMLPADIEVNVPQTGDIINMI